MPTYTPTPTLTPTPVPPQSANPPIMNIGFPSEMQNIELSSDESLCVVDIPAGGNTSGLQRKHNLNEAGWTGYEDMFTLCIDPQEGLNRLQLKYKNSAGEESVTYTRQFNFHRQSDLEISFSGEIFRDENCNGIRDTGENLINTYATVRFFKQPEYSIYDTITSESSGSFNYVTTISGGENLVLEPSVESAVGYKSNPNWQAPEFTFNSSSQNHSVSYPQVPNEYVDQCTLNY